MGADGWIDLYDYDKACQLGFKTFIEKWMSPSYINEIFGRNVMLIYSETEVDHRSPEVYPFDYPKKLWRGEVYTLEDVEIFEKLHSECFLDTWEVWT